MDSHHLSGVTAGSALDNLEICDVFRRPLHRFVTDTPACRNELGWKVKERKETL